MEAFTDTLAALNSIDPLFANTGAGRSEVLS